MTVTSPITPLLAEGVLRLFVIWCCAVWGWRLCRKLLFPEWPLGSEVRDWAGRVGIAVLAAYWTGFF